MPQPSESDRNPATTVPEESPGATVASPPSPPTNSGQGTQAQVSGFPSDAPNRNVPLIPGYEILEELGRGGMGVVYKARQARVNRLVALKMMLPGFASSPEAAGRFRSEAEAVAKIQHPNVIQIYEVGEEAGQPWFSLEFCDQGALNTRLKGNIFAARESARMVESLAGAIAAAHRGGIIHRDLKPANILICSEHSSRASSFSVPVPSSISSAKSAPKSGREAESAPGTSILLKVTDFGLAKQLGADDGHTRTGDIMGTPGYMAPEQAAGGTKHVGPGADIYALGAILYEMLTGRPPFRGASLLETLEQVRSQEPVSPRLLQAGTPRDIEIICLKCLRKEPEKRYLTADELAEDLHRFLTDTPIRARPVPQREVVWRWCRRNPAIAGLLALLVLVLTAGFLGMASLWTQAEDQRRRAEGSAENALNQQALAEANERDAIKLRIEAEQNEKEALRLRREAEQQQKLALLEADKARRVSGFMVDIFEGNDPLGLNNALAVVPSRTGQNLTARYLLDQGAAKLAKANDLPRESRLLLKQRIGRVYLTLTLLDNAIPLLQSSVEDYKDKPDAPELAESYHLLGWGNHLAGNYFEAGKFYRQALDLRLKQIPLNEEDVATTEFTYSWMLIELEDFASARVMMNKALERRMRIFGKDHRQVAFAHIGLATVSLADGSMIEGLNHTKTAMTILNQQDGSGKLSIVIAKFQEGVLEGLLKKQPKQAIVILEEGLKLMRELVGNEHLHMCLYLYQLGYFHAQLNQDDEAENYFRQTLELVRKLQFMTHPKTATLIRDYLSLLVRQDRPEEAKNLLAEWLDAHRRKTGNPFLADALVIQAMFVQRMEGDGPSLVLLEDSVKLFRQQNNQFLRRFHEACLHHLSSTYLRMSRPLDAEKLARERLELVRKYRPDSKWSNESSFFLLADATLDQQRTSAEVLGWLEALRSSWKPGLFGKAPPDLPLVYVNLSRHYRLSNPPDPRKGIEAITEGLRFSIEADHHFLNAREYAVQATILKKNPAQTDQKLAEEWYQKCLKSLAEAATRGYDRKSIEAEAAFEPLRIRPEFQAVLKKNRPKK